MKELQVSLLNSEYKIKIDKGLIDKIGVEISSFYSGDKIAVITDENVHSHYGDKVEEGLKAAGFQVITIVLPPGEKTKSMEWLLFLYDKLLDYKINRGNLILALGGGVIGDLTGFCASTLLRGIPFVQIPTSLLAQVDSSVGGKVAIDLPKGKNLVGSFYQPQAVYIDPEVLSTLDKKYINDGMGEVIKSALIKDEKLFNELEGIQNYEELLGAMEDIIYSCCAIKSKVVEADERDMGERMILNFGHTIGHAIEKVQNYQGLSHGEAVAVGMYEITLRSEALGLTKIGVADKIKKILAKFQLPYELPIKESIMDSITLDKKNIGENINLVLLKDIGEGFIYKVKQSEARRIFNKNN